MRKIILKKTGSFLKEYRGSVFAVLALSLLLRVSVSAAQQTLLQQGIAGEVLRFHVLANSDTQEDQRVKYLVRDAVLAWISEELGEAEAEMTREQMRSFLAERLAEIEAEADRVLEKEGMDYRAEAEIEKCRFPERTYGECTFPGGWYEALRIRLGAARGQNWWCVLYPKLCFEDCVRAVVGEDQMKQLEEVLTAEEYESLTKQPQKWKISFRWF